MGYDEEERETYFVFLRLLGGLFDGLFRSLLFLAILLILGRILDTMNEPTVACNAVNYI